MYQALEKICHTFLASCRHLLFTQINYAMDCTAWMNAPHCLRRGDDADDGVVEGRAVCAAAAAPGLVAAAAGERDGEETLRDARAVGGHVLRKIGGRIHSTSQECFRRQVKCTKIGIRN